MHWSRETQENYNRQDPALALNVVMPKIFICCFPLSTDKFPTFLLFPFSFCFQTPFSTYHFLVFAFLLFIFNFLSFIVHFSTV